MTAPTEIKKYQSAGVYVGNQLVAGGQYQSYTCRAGVPGQIDIRVLPYS